MADAEVVARDRTMLDVEQSLGLMLSGRRRDVVADDGVAQHVEQSLGLMLSGRRRDETRRTGGCPRRCGAARRDVRGDELDWSPRDVDEMVVARDAAAQHVKM